MNSASLSRNVASHDIRAAHYYWREINEDTLANVSLPELDRAADKESRGQILVIAGSREIVGAAILSSVAAMRAGAGKLTIATASSMAAQVGIAVPEARVIALPETAEGGFDVRGVDLLRPCLEQSGAVLVGPGMLDAEATRAFVANLFDSLGSQTDCPVLLDALAMDAALNGHRFDSPVMLTPHAGEMAHLTGMSKETVCAHPVQTAQSFAQGSNALVALKGAESWIATPAGSLWRHEGHNPGMGTSGSGDVLAGVIAGLLARGAGLEEAAVWGVAIHARAGAALRDRHGPLGFLAREMLDEIPRAMCAHRTRSLGH